MEHSVFTDGLTDEQIELMLYDPAFGGPDLWEIAEEADHISDGTTNGHTGHSLAATG